MTHKTSGSAAAQGPVLPLEGTRVLDLTRALSGPFCTALLGDLGADVVKVESLTGDICRNWGPYQDSESLYFASANRNKRSMAMDMWSPAGRALLQRIVGDFDVVVENFRPGVIDALGLGAGWLSEHHPDVLLASISGFGQVGPMRHETCFDQIAQGVGGLMSLNGDPEGDPMRSGIPLSDILSGMFSALGICAALVGRRRHRTVHTSLLESVLGVLTFQAQRYLSLGEIPQREGNDHPVVSPYGVFHTEDGQINVAAGTSVQWSALCNVLGASELEHDERFATPRQRVANKIALRDALDSYFRKSTSESWLAALKAAEVPSGPINNVAEAFGEPQVEALGMIQEVDHFVLGPMPMARGPLWIDGSPTPVRRPAPALGQQTREILRDAKLSPEDIERLLADGSVAEYSQDIRAGENPTGR